MAPIMQEAMLKEDFERMEAGKPPLKKPNIVREDPGIPEISDLIRYEDINVNEVLCLVSANRKVIKNKEGVNFIGYHVVIEMEKADPLEPEEPQKRPPGRPRKILEPSPLMTRTIDGILSGWMIEGDFLRLYREVRDKINIDVVNW